MSELLPNLLDRERLIAELDVTKAAADKIIQRLPIVTFENLRKVYVRRDDAARLIDERTFDKDEVQP